MESSIYGLKAIPMLHDFWHENTVVANCVFYTTRKQKPTIYHYALNWSMYPLWIVDCISSEKG